MKLVLDVIKSSQDSLAKRSLHLNKENGVIGRASQADLQLADSQNYISKIHLYIEYQDNLYFVRDESTNGTYLKFPYKKLPKGNNVKINPTDIFVLGEYEIQARFVEEDFSTSIMDQINTSTEEEDEIGIIPDNDFLDEPFDSLESNEIDVTDIISNSKKFVYEDEMDDDEVEYEITGEIDEHYMSIPEAKKEESVTDSVVADTSLQKSLAILEKKLGIEISSLEKKERDVLMEEIGSIIINSLSGLKHSLYIQQKIKEDMNVLKTDEKETVNPILLGDSASKLLQNKQFAGMLGFSKISDAVLQSFNELDRHNIALHSSAKNLMNITIQKFSPVNLGHYFEKKGTLKGLLKPKASKMWDGYQEMFKEFEQEPEKGVQLLQKDFEKEYKSSAFGVSLATQQRVK